jgi:CRP-like cAMP-binding protein
MGGVKDEVVEQLACCGLFEGVSKKGLRQIADMAKEMTFDAGEEVKVEATRGTRFHLVLDGTAEVTHHGRRLSVVGPGDTIGEMALLDGQPSSATVTALEPLRTLSLTSWNFRSLLHKEPTIQEKILLGLVRRLRAADDR